MRVTHKMLKTMLEDEEVWEAIEAAVKKVATSIAVVQENAETLAKEKKIMAPTPKVGRARDKKYFGVSVHQSVISVSSSTPPSPENSALSRTVWKMQWS